LIIYRIRISDDFDPLKSTTMILSDTIFTALWRNAEHKTFRFKFNVKTYKKVAKIF